MADRIFAGLLLLVTLAYGFIAFTIIEAPFQYDPLGPESWPQILAVASVICLVFLLWKPDLDHFGSDRPSALRILYVVILLFAYAELFERLGFILATFGFATIMSRMLGCQWGRSVIFGAAAGVLGYLVCAGLLDLNLPAGPLPKI